MKKQVVLISCCVLSVMMTSTASAQQDNTVTVPGIPVPLKWDNHPKAWRVSATGIMIESGAKTDMFRDPNVTYNTDNAPKLMFTPAADFVLSASIQHSFSNKWDGGAIVLRKDSLNWVKFCFEKDYTGARRVVSVVTKDISDDCNSVASATDKMYFKLAKAGNVITLYCSEDGRQWLLVRHLQMHVDGPMQVGFLAQSPTGDNCVVSFDNISYRAVTIKDPYAGE